MKIIRYSSTGFTPQKQTYHIKKFESWKNLNPKDYHEMAYTIQKLNNSILSFITNTKKIYKKDYGFL